MNIQVDGKHGEGKTTILALIVDQLRTCGYSPTFADPEEAAEVERLLADRGQLLKHAYAVRVRMRDNHPVSHLVLSARTTTVHAKVHGRPSDLSLEQIEKLEQMERLKNTE